MASESRDEAEAALAAVVAEEARSFLRQVLGAVLAAIRGGRTEEAQPVLALGVMLGWWTDAVSNRVVATVQESWRAAFGATLGGATVVGPRADAMSFHVAAVRDRLSRSALPEVPEAAFDQVRLSQSDAALGGWGAERQARDIAERLAWEPDKSYWQDQKAYAESRIDEVLDPLGRPGAPAREYARRNDPVVAEWQRLRAEAVDRVREDESDWQVRATRIARTESTAAWNSGALAALAAEGVPYKRWVATPGDRTRESHREADGQVVPLPRPFHVGDSLLMMPGDPSAPPWETVNCRCTVVGSDGPASTVTAGGAMQDEHATLVEALAREDAGGAPESRGEYKPPHAPAGSPKGGQFIPPSKSGGGSKSKKGKKTDAQRKAARNKAVAAALKKAGGAVDSASKYLKAQAAKGDAAKVKARIKKQVDAMDPHRKDAGGAGPDAVEVKEQRYDEMVKEIQGYLDKYSADLRPEDRQRLEDTIATLEESGHLADALTEQMTADGLARFGPLGEDFSRTVCVVALPAEGDSVHELGPEEKHATLLYFGKQGEHLPGGDLAKALISQAVGAVASRTEPFAAKVTGVEPLGDEDPPAQVWLLDSPDLQEMFEAIPAESAEVQDMYDVATENGVKRYPDYRPHVTIGYGGPEVGTDEATEGGLVSDDDLDEARQVEGIAFDRLSLWWGDERVDFPLGGDDTAEFASLVEALTFVADEAHPPPAEERDDPFTEVDECTCCGGRGEHACGHECYACDASGTREAQGEGREPICPGHHGVPDPCDDGRQGVECEHETDAWDPDSAPPGTPPGDLLEED